MAEVTLQTLFGCDVRDLTAQFGINQNPSVLTISVVRDDKIGQQFALADVPQHGARHLERIRFGALDMWGLVQFWDEEVVNIAGTGTFNVRVTDTKPVLECVDVVLGSPLGIVLGENIVGVPAELMDDADSGIRYSLVKPAIEAATIAYGDNRFKVVLGNLNIPDRVIDGYRVPYRVPCGSLSLLSLIQQIADDHGIDWYVETRETKTAGVYAIVVKPLVRQTAVLDMEGLAAMHTDAVIRLNKGHETRDEVVRTVVLGPNKQTLVQTLGITWRPFWGFDDDGYVLRGPQFKLTDAAGSTRWRTTTYAEMEAALNDEISNLPQDELNALRSYADDYWGRQFYSEVAPTEIDPSGTPWVETSPGGWWERAGNPDNLPKDGELKFQSDDGRWTTFVKLRDPKFIAGRWDDSVLYSENVVKATVMGYWYMKASVERVDLHRVEGRINNARASIFLLTLPNPLTVVTNRAKISVDAADRSSRLQAGIYIVDLDQKRLTPNILDLTKIPQRFLEDGRSEPVEEGLGVRWIIDPKGDGTGSDDAGDTSNYRRTRVSELDRVFMAILDRRRVYGPWTSDSIIPANQRVPGKSRVVVDTSLAPWTFGYRGISHAVDYVLATRNLNAVGQARVRAATNLLTEVDTGELEAAGMPAVNMGTEIGRGTNITSIVCVRSIQGIRTSYKCNLYTNELGRWQKLYQDLVDRLRRAAQLKQNTLYPQADYRVIMQAVKLAKKAMTVERRSQEKVLTDNPTLVAKIVSRASDAPEYDCVVYAQKASSTDDTRRIDPDTQQTIIERTMASTGQHVTVWNQAEPSNKGGRLYAGMYIEIRKAEDKGVVFDYYVTNESPPAPESCACTVAEYIRSDSETGYPVYRVVLKAGDTRVLYQTEVQRLSEAINKGERQGAPGRLRIGAEVNVDWIEQADGTYWPVFNQSEGGAPNVTVGTVSSVVGAGSSDGWPLYRVTPSGSLQGLHSWESQKLQDGIPNRGEKGTPSGYLQAGDAVTLLWQRTVNPDGSIEYVPYLEKALNIFVAPTGVA